MEAFENNIESEVNNTPDADIQDSSQDPATFEVNDLEEPSLATAEDMSALKISSGSPNYQISSPAPEPETIRVWRENQQQLLTEKDAREQDEKTKLRDTAKKELDEWYKKYDTQMDRRKSDNRQADKSFVAEVNDIDPGTEWDRVHKLCDFSSKTSANRHTKDVSRLRSLLLQLSKEKNGQQLS